MDAAATRETCVRPPRNCYFSRVLRMSAPKVFIAIAFAVSLTNGRQTLFHFESCRIIYEININFSTICCTTAACACDLQGFTAVLQCLFFLALSLSLAFPLFHTLTLALSLLLAQFHAKCSIFSTFHSFLLMLRQTECV